MLFRTLREETNEAVDGLLKLWDQGDFAGFYRSVLEQHRHYLAQAKQPDLMEKDSANAHKALLRRVQQIVQGADIGRLFVNLNQIEEAVDEAAAKSPLLARGAKNLKKQIKVIWSTLNDVSKKPSSHNLFLKLIDQFEEADKIFRYFAHCRTFLEDAESLLEKKMKPTKEEAPLSLGFTVDIQTLAEFNFRLNSVQVIYTEACLLLGVNEQKYPLNVLKIESGSLWGKLFGENKVIEFISWFLKNSIKYLHRNFTVEGKLARIPADIKTLNEELKLNNKLKEILPLQKYKTLVNGHAEAVAKSAALLAKHTQNLLEKETKLTVDDEVIELSAPDSTKYLQEAQKQLPEHVDFKVIDIEPDAVKLESGEEKG